MIDYFISIPGPYFLFIYAVYAMVIILFFKLYVNKDYSHNFEVPEPTKLQPTDIAILKNGVKGAILTSLFNIWRLKGVDISLDKKSILLKQLHTDTTKFNKLEKIIYEYIKQPTYYKQLYNVTLVKTIENKLHPNLTRLQELNLIPDSKIIKHHWRGFIYGTILLLGFGGLKLYFGIVRDKPITFLILLMLTSVIILFNVVNPKKVRISALGKKLLVKTHQRFAWLKSSKEYVTMGMDDNLLYGIAIFGISSFIGTELGKYLENPMLLDQRMSSNGNGFGCSSCGGGCGGGGCGGGCGGCGGD